MDWEYFLIEIRKIREGLQEDQRRWRAKAEKRERETEERREREREEKLAESRHQIEEQDEGNKKEDERLMRENEEAISIINIVQDDEGLMGETISITNNVQDPMEEKRMRKKKQSRRVGKQFANVHTKRGWKPDQKQQNRSENQRSKCVRKTRKKGKQRQKRKKKQRKERPLIRPDKRRLIRPGKQNVINTKTRGRRNSSDKRSEKQSWWLKNQPLRRGQGHQSRRQIRRKVACKRSEKMSTTKESEKHDGKQMKECGLVRTEVIIGRKTKYHVVGAEVTNAENRGWWKKKGYVGEHGRQQGLMPEKKNLEWPWWDEKTRVRGSCFVYKTKQSEIKVEPTSGDQSTRGERRWAEDEGVPITPLVVNDINEATMAANGSVHRAIAVKSGGTAATIKGNNLATDEDDSTVERTFLREEEMRSRKVARLHVILWQKVGPLRKRRERT